MTYTVITWKEEGLWSALSPAIPGVFGIGKTEAAAKKDFADSFAEMSAYLHEIGEKLPKARTLRTHTFQARP